MFPLDGNDYDGERIAKFDALIEKHHVPWKLKDLLPEVRVAGEDAGTLTEAGAKLLDPSGKAYGGYPRRAAGGGRGHRHGGNGQRAPQRTGNVSSGYERCSRWWCWKSRSPRYTYPEIDMVTTPSGDPVAMVHCNELSDVRYRRLGEHCYGECLSAFAGGAVRYGQDFTSTLYDPQRWRAMRTAAV